MIDFIFMIHAIYQVNNINSRLACDFSFRDFNNLISTFGVHSVFGEFSFIFCSYFKLVSPISFAFVSAIWVWWVLFHILFHISSSLSYFIFGYVGFIVVFFKSWFCFLLAFLNWLCRSVFLLCPHSLRKFGSMEWKLWVFGFMLPRKL